MVLVFERPRPFAFRLSFFDQYWKEVRKHSHTGDGPAGTDCSVVGNEGDGFFPLGDQGILCGCLYG